MSSTELKPIVLYDIPCLTPGRPWSPNTMKTRYCLGYKQLPFTTVWVEFPNIAGLIQFKGVTQPPYTLPAIEDSNTGAFVVESLAIAAYLDESYPETPKVLTPVVHRTLGGLSDIFSFGSTGGALADPTVTPRLVFLVLAGERLNPVSKAYYHTTRAARLGERWTTVVDACMAGPEGRAERVQHGVEAIRGVWRKVTTLYAHPPEQAPVEGNKPAPGPFALGEEPCFFDFAVAGRIKFLLEGLTPSEADELRISEGDKLFQLVENLEKYYKY